MRRHHAGDEQDSWVIPPWELPGNFRLDSQPHNGPLLRRLANTAFVLGVIACCPCVCLLGSCIGVPGPAAFGSGIGLGLLGASFGLVTAALARRDLAKMRTGLVNPTGLGETEFALRRAAWGVVLGIVSVLLGGGAWLMGQ